MIFAGGMLLTGCTTQEDEQADSSNPVAVSFHAGIQTLTRTTEGGDTWMQNDEIGIYMFPANGNWFENFLTNAENKKYTVQNASTGALVPGDGTDIYYPESGDVSIVAYYPHGIPKTEINSNTMNIPYAISANLTNQSNPAAIDLLYAQATDISKSGTPVNLQFKHVASKITLNVTAGDGFTAENMTALAAENVTIDEIGIPRLLLSLEDRNIYEPYEKSNTTDIPLYKQNPASPGTAATFSAIIYPESRDSYGITFTINGVGYTCTLTSDDSFLAGKNYIFPVKVSKTGISVPPPTITDWETNHHSETAAQDLQIEVAHISVGTFMMGSPENEQDRYMEETQHQVTLTKDFYMGKYEVTNVQYAEFLNVAGIGQDGKFSTSHHGEQTLIVEDTHKARGVIWNGTQWEPVSGKDNNPVVFVTWYGADEFARWIGGSLPTEAQWEYACRAGTTTSRSFGEDDSLLDNYAWYGANSNSSSHPVGQKQPNEWGLYDMYGNANEWCADWYGLYTNKAVTDPTGPETGDGRIIRGATYLALPRYCRSAARTSLTPETPTDNTGFRVVFN